MNSNKLIFEKSVRGRKGYSLPSSDVPKIKLDKHIDKKLLRSTKIGLPEMTEPQIVRHFVNLSIKNHHVDRDFYPLGSCTMKYNPKINEVLANTPEFRNLHPESSIKSAQGALHLIFELEQMLLKITGMSRATLQPSAGSQGEFAGLLIIKKYHEQNKSHRKYIIIPETAHGTNPASVILAGYETLQVKTDERGRIDLKHLKSLINPEVAGMMLTQPNTLGLFEDEIHIISNLIHSIDGLMYMDGANLNALIGLCRPIDMGFDITHINLHKTFSTPHGGGGPGAGPIAVVDKLVPYLPTPIIEKDKKGLYFLNNKLPNSIGRLHTFYGNYSILIRAYVYIRMLGEDGLKTMTKNAIINANYLKSLIKDYFEIPYSNGTLHEFVASGIKQKSKGVKVIDIAKALLDYGFHAPTIYFPINIAESMMIEPTESETKETIDRFANALIEIDKLINIDPDKVLNAPQSTPVRRLDETKANRELDLQWGN